jgi:DNA-binding MarR family transcriptional regulator
MNPEETIFFRLAKANQSASRFWKKQLSPYKLTAVQGLVLVFLYVQDGLTSAALGQRMRLDSATLAGVLTRLEKSGLAARCPDTEDRRAVRVHLTASGRDVGRRVAATMQTAHARFLASLNGEGASRLMALLHHIGRNDRG